MVQHYRVMSATWLNEISSWDILNVVCPHQTTTIWHPAMGKSAFEDAVGSSTTYQKTLEECHPIMCGNRHTDPNPSCESCSGPQTTAPGLLGSGITMTWQSETITHRQVRLYLSPGLLRRSFSIPTEKKKYEFGHPGEGKWKQFDFIHNNPSPRWHSSGPREILACDSFHEGKWEPGSECLTSPTIWNSFSISLSPYPEY